MSLTDEDALTFLIHWMREGMPGDYPSYGYEIYMTNAIRSYLRSVEINPDDRAAQRQVEELSPYFYDAAWELCRRGIIRPGLKKMGGQATPDGSGGNGYSITPFGRQWIAESARDDFIPTEPGRFAEMLKPFLSRFGPGFHERAQEAIRCYGAHAYLACCSMCGAAAESILLSTTIEKVGEERALKDYTTANGRRKVENILLGKSKDSIKQEFLGYTILLKYWRDEASHGRASKISDNEAYTSLAMLLRFSKYVDEHWKELTTHP